MENENKPVRYSVSLSEDGYTSVLYRGYERRDAKLIYDTAWSVLAEITGGDEEDGATTLSYYADDRDEQEDSRFDIRIRPMTYAEWKAENPEKSRD